MRKTPHTGPSRLELIQSLPRLLRNPLPVFLDWHERYGDFLTVPFRNPPPIHVADPDDIRHILVTNSANYRKTGALIIGRRLMGQGLLASGEPLHTQQRKIVKPHFHQQSVESFARLMEETTIDQISRWRTGKKLNILPEMARLTIIIIGKACFSTDLSPMADQLCADFASCQKFMQKLINLPESFPTPGNSRYLKAVGRIDTIARTIIAERRSQTSNRPPDLLTTLLEARGTDGNPLTEGQIRDEIVNIMLAGHETTAVALAWTWYFLALHGDVEERFHQEIDTVVGTGPASGQISRLRYSEMVLNESMRLRPPVWILARVALKDDTLGSGRSIPAGSEVLMMPYIAHRNRKYFPDPESFDPERFSSDNGRARPPFVYFPFGGGPRGCIGEIFARMEATIILATLARRFSLHLVPGYPVTPEPLVTLRPKHGILMEIRDRASHEGSPEVRTRLVGRPTAA